MPGITGDNQALYERDMYKAKLEAVEAEPMVYPQIYSSMSDNMGLGNKETQILKLGELKQHTAEDESLDFKSPTQGWTTYTAYQTFSDGLAFSREAVERVTKSEFSQLLQKMAKTWGMSEVVEKETYASTVFNEGGTLAGNAVFNGSYLGQTDSSGDLLYDSVPFFALSGNNHVPKGGGTGYYNSVAGLTLTVDNFQTIYNLHVATNNRDELNRVVRNPADTLLTTVGDDAIKAMEILETQQRPGGQLNDINVFSRFGLNHIAWDYLTDSAFYVGKAKTDELTFVDAQPARIRFFRDEETLGYKASVHMMFSVWLKAGVWKRWTRGGGSSS